MPALVLDLSVFADKVPIMSPSPAFESQANGAALTISDIGKPLAHTTFVIVDLETAGGKPVSGFGD